MSRAARRYVKTAHHEPRRLVLGENHRVAVDKSGERVREMFAQIAPRYDLLNHLLSLGIDRYWRWQTVRRVPPTGSAPLLDLCTGTGDLALAYYRAGGGQVTVLGADFCHPMLVRGQAKAAQQTGHAGLHFLEADAQQLPFADETFQLVCVAFGLRNVSDTDRALREMSRVCRRGGAVVVLEFSEPTWAPIRSVYNAYFRHVLPRIGQAVARNRHAAYNYLPASVAEFPSGTALLTRFQHAGLVDNRYWPLTFGVATLYAGRKPD